MNGEQTTFDYWRTRLLKKITLPDFSAFRINERRFDERVLTPDCSRRGRRSHDGRLLLASSYRLGHFPRKKTEPALSI